MKSKNLMFAGALVLGILVIGVIAAAGITGYQIRLFKGQKATLPDGSTLERTAKNDFVVTPSAGSSVTNASNQTCNCTPTPIGIITGLNFTGINITWINITGVNKTGDKVRIDLMPKFSTESGEIILTDDSGSKLLRNKGLKLTKSQKFLIIDKGGHIKL